MSGIAFQNVAGLTPGRTRFDFHISKKFDTEMGILYPIFCKRVLPGDYFNISNEILVRNTPLAYPVMHEVSIDTHYFLVYERDVDDTNSIPGSGNPAGDPELLGANAPPAGRFNYEQFITGGFNGMDTQTTPKWDPDESWGGYLDTEGQIPHPAIAIDTANNLWNGRRARKFNLWDAYGLPIIENPNMTWLSPVKPVDAIRRAYNYIFNMYYRDQTAMPPVPWDNMFMLCRAWRKDYFTSALPFQQRGEAPAFPVELSGTLKAVFNYTDPLIIGQSNVNTAAPSGSNIEVLSVPSGSGRAIGVSNGNISVNSIMTPTAANNLSISNTIDMSQGNAYTFDVADLRNVVQLQKYLERNARAGVRLNEWLRAHFGVDNGDSHLGRPIYIGGTKQPLVISEVLQTSETSGNSPQGTMSGHGISAYGNDVGKINVKDHGFIIGILSIMPTPSYSQGINRQFLQDTNLDYFTPEFVNLSEQAIINAEIYINNDSSDQGLFAYQGMYDEYRTMNSEFTGNFRDTLEDWHLGRKFNQQPKWGGEFITCKPQETRRIFMVQNEPGFLVDVEHYFTAVRPLPEIAEPGLLDHH